MKKNIAKLTPLVGDQRGGERCGREVGRMNDKIINGMKCILCLFGLLVLGQDKLYAGEPEGKHAAPNISNIGFMENPPKELKEKFTMCDAFLKVEWIDKEKKIGYARYDFYKHGKKYGKVASAMVHLDEDRPAYDYNLEEFRTERELQDLFGLIKRGEVYFDFSNMAIRVDQGEKRYAQEFSFIPVDWNERGLSLGDHKMNVCIPYPDNQRMFLAETREVGKVYGKDVIAKKLIEIKKSIPDLAFPDYFGSYVAIDLNSDGKADYIYWPSIVYSYGNSYYVMNVSDSMEGEINTKLVSPTGQGNCGFLRQGGLYITTDGNSFYLNNRCNLTKLTRGAK